jgi:hypothetical protein
MPVKRKLDYIWQPPDHRDFKFTPKWSLMAALPPSFSLPVPQVIDQGELGSCGPSSIDGLIRSNMLAQGMEVRPTSRLFTYWNTRYLIGMVNEDSGVYNRVMMKALAKWGYAAPESLWPYNKPFKEQPTDNVYTAALPNVLTSYAAVEQNLQIMKATIMGGDPFVFGFTCYPQLISDQAARDGLIAMPSGNAIGGHDIVLLGWDDNMRCPGTNTPGAFKFLNSWGEWWGQKGLGWFPYEYATDANEAGDFWVINAIPQEDIKPEPEPERKPLFNFRLPRALTKGSVLKINGVPAMSAGKYSVFPLEK